MTTSTPTSPAATTRFHLSAAAGAALEAAAAPTSETAAADPTHQVGDPSDGGAMRGSAADAAAPGLVDGTDQLFFTA